MTPKYEKLFFHDINFYFFIALSGEISFTGSSIRCDNNLVSVGDLKIKVLDRCGEPILKEKIELGSTRHRKSDDNYRYLEQWMYEFHYGYYDVLTFKGGKLAKIESMIPK